MENKMIDTYLNYFWCYKNNYNTNISILREVANTLCYRYDYIISYHIKKLKNMKYQNKNFEYSSIVSFYDKDGRSQKSINESYNTLMHMIENETEVTEDILLKLENLCDKMFSSIQVASAYDLLIQSKMEYIEETRKSPMEKLMREFDKSEDEYDLINMSGAPDIDPNRVDYSKY